MSGFTQIKSGCFRSILRTEVTNPLDTEIVLIIMPDPAFFLGRAGAGPVLPDAGIYDLRVSSCPDADVRAVDVVLGETTNRAETPGECEPRGSNALTEPFR